MATWQSCQEKRKTRRLKSSFTGKALKAKTITVFPHTQFQVSNSIPAFKQTVMTTSCKTRDQEDLIHWRYLWSSWQAREDWWYKSNITWFLDGKQLKNSGEFVYSFYFTQKGGGNTTMGVTLRWTSVPSGGSGSTPSHASWQGNRDKLQLFWAFG